MSKAFGIALTVSALCGVTFSAEQADFVRMTCNAAGETRDLQVGLWAWPAVMDYDDDGDMDLVVSCPCGPYNGIFLFRNPGGSAKPIFGKAEKVGEKGVWSFVRSTSAKGHGRDDISQPGKLFADFPKNGFGKGVPFGDVPENVHTNKATRGNVWRRVDFNNDGLTDLLIGVDDWVPLGKALWSKDKPENYAPDGTWIGPEPYGFVYLVRNLGVKDGRENYAKPEHVRLADGRPMMTFGNPMPMCEDWDGDGDLDILCGEFVDGFSYFENVGTRSAPKYAAAKAVRDESGDALKMDLCMITPSAYDWDGDGKLDIICGDEDGRVAFIRNAGFRVDGVPVFEKPYYFKQEQDLLSAGDLATPFGIDWDGDGDWDLICGNGAGNVVFLENLSGPGVTNPRWAAPVKLKAGGETIHIFAGLRGSIQGTSERKWGYTCLSAGDWDGDGLPDLIVNSIWGDVVWFRNVGTRQKPSLAPAQGVEVEWEGEQPSLAWGWYRPSRKGNPKELLTQWRTTPVMFDWNGDGLMDLVMLDHQGYLAFFERAKRGGKLVLLPPKRCFVGVEGLPLHLNVATGGSSGRRKLAIADWDGDGLPDLLADGRNALFYRNLGTEGGVTRFAPPYDLAARRLSNHTTAPTTVDFDADGKPELVLGAEDGFLYYLSR